MTGWHGVDILSEDLLFYPFGVQFGLVETNGSCDPS